MIHAEEMKDAVEHKDAEFVFHGVAELGGLSRSSIEGDGDLAWPAVGGQEGKDVGGVVAAPKAAVQRAQFAVGGDEADSGAVAANPDGKLGPELTQGAAADVSRRMAE
jgi:hypothetical protein